MLPKNLLIALGAIVIIAGGWIFGNGQEGAPKTSTESANTAAVLNIVPRPGEIVVTGVLECTPLKSGAPVAEGECVMGLKGDDSKFYSLDISKMEEAFGTELSSGVMTVGTFAVADTSSEEAGDYKYDGVLTVRAIESY